MACGIFCGCSSLCELTFEIPSHLKQLDLPPGEFGSLCIPDCVEVVGGGIGKQNGQRRLLQFGRKSSLANIELRRPGDLWHIRQNTDTESDSFLDLSEEILRRFRCHFEGV
jgi:hypothetical protein